MAHAWLRNEERGKFDGLLIVYNTLKERGQPNASLLSEAWEVTRTIEDDWERANALAALAEALAEIERFNRALAVLGLRELDEFLETLAKWAPSFEQVKPGLSIDALREATGVAAWVRSDWREIHELLNS